MKPKHRSPARDGQTAGEARQDSTAPNDAPLEQFEDAVLLLSEQGIVDCNAAALRLFHCTQHDDLAGRQLADFSPALQPDGQPSGEKLRTLLSQARRAGLARYEWVHQRRNGASFPAEVFVTGLPIGEPGPLYAVICDITERKQAAAALERTRLLLEAVIEQSPVPTVVASAPDLIVRYANRASVEQLGIADEPSYLGLSLPEAQQRQTWRDLHADGTPIVMSELPLARALRGEPTHSEELSVIRKDGTRAWELVSSTPIYDRDGTLIAGLVVFPDITDRKQAEEERARLIAILEQTSDLVSTATIDGRLTYLNAAGRRLVGWSPTEDVTQHRIADLHPDWAHDHIATSGIPTALAHGIWQGEAALRGPDDTEIPVSQVIVAHRAATGEPVYLSTIMRDIRAQRRTEEQLRLAEYSIEHSGLPTIWFDRQARVVRVNEAACQSLGYTRDELLQMTVRDFDPDFQDPQRWDAVWEKTRQLDRCVVLETRHRRKDGTCFPVEVVSSQFAFGKQEYIFSFARDITERQHIERALRESEATLRSTVRAVPAVIGIITADRKTAYVNDQIQQMLGYAPEEVVGVNAQFLYVDEDEYRRVGLALYSDLWQSGSNQTEGRMRHKDGREVHVLFRAAPLQPNNPAAGAVVTLLDITDRKQAEAALSTSEARYRGLFERSAEGMLLIDGDRVIDCNDAAARMLRYASRAALLEKHPWDISPPQQPDGQSSQELAIRMIQQADIGDSLCFEWDHAAADGTIVPIEVVLTAIPVGERRLLHVAWRDITARRRAEREQERLETQLRQSQKMEAVGQLAGGIAHDFNNILTAIFGNVEIVLAHLEEQEPAPDALCEHLQQVVRSAERAAGLTRQLLAFSRRQVIRPVVLDLNAALRDLEKMLRRLIAENIELQLTPAPGVAAIEIDPGQLEQVVVNLVVNARDAMADGGHLTLRTSQVLLDAQHADTHAGARTGPHVLLEITDTGCGMSSAVLEHIFEPFFTTKPVGRGTGLGLSTVYGIVHQAGGHIDVQSQPGQGTCFRLYWPVPQQPLPVTVPPTPADDAPTGTETILVCEDDDPVRELITQTLSDAGYTVLVAPNPQAALRIAARHIDALQLLVTDIIMPDMNGRVLSEELLKLRPNVRTLFISGYASDIIAHHGVPAECAEFLEKPFSPRGLLVRVRQLLDKGSPSTPSAGTAGRADCT